MALGFALLVRTEAEHGTATGVQQVSDSEAAGGRSDSCYTASDILVSGTGAGAVRSAGSFTTTTCIDDG